MKEMAKLRVAIIGAGGAGLSMCRCLANEPQIDFVAFEKSREIGGVWQYTKDKKERKYHTAMYKNLRYCLSVENRFCIVGLAPHATVAQLKQRNAFCLTEATVIVH